MFLHLIFKKFSIKEDKYLMAGIYGLIYFIFSFLLLFFSLLYLKKQNLGYTFAISLFAGMVMFIVYLIRWEVIKAGFSMKKRQKR
jgi:hypothetical protein